MRNWRAALGAMLALAMGSTMVRAQSADAPAVDPFWRNATVYFLLTDRFANGDPRNDTAVGRKADADQLRGYLGGDIRGITQKIESGYFTALGVDAIWTTPLIENVHGSVGEGQWGKTYAYHGYWPLDWTAVDPNLGTEADFAAMVAAAHKRGIRIIVDVIANHSGPETALDPRWPDSWVRRTPSCDYKSYAGSVSCELSFTLQDMRTESAAPVELPAFLVDKWRREGRLAQETAELDAFFARTGYPRAPKYYLVKWLADWVRDYGVDGFRVDTAKHVDADVWAALRRETDLALADWRARHPRRITGDKPFYMVGEVFNHGLLGFGNAKGRGYDYGDRTVDFHANGFDGLINMGFASHLRELPLPELYSRYDRDLATGGAFAGRATLNYLASHDDMGPFDPERREAYADAARLLLAPGGAQIYYGDELARSLVVPGTKGDATLRSAIDWRAAARPEARQLLAHWGKLGRFRQRHPAVGAGRHIELQRAPFVFARVLDEGNSRDRVVIATDLAGGAITVPVGDAFAEGARLRDAYSGQTVRVQAGKASLPRTGRVLLLEPAGR